MEEFGNNIELESSQDKSNCRGSKSGCSGSHGSGNETTPLKSNLKKTTIVEANQPREGTRKVTWPDDHGKSIACVQEFEPSVSEDEEQEGVQNSCVCAIQ